MPTVAVCTFSGKALGTYPRTLIRLKIERSFFEVRVVEPIIGARKTWSREAPTSLVNFELRQV